MSGFVSAAPGAGVLALRTPTLPPATHTNTYLLGRDALTVVDPASPYDDEQGRLLDALVGLGGRIERILLTHHHHDHVGGALALRDALRERYVDVPIVAHPITAAWLGADLPIDAVLVDGDVVETDDGHRWHALHTPGHAPGHLVLHGEHGPMVAGDMVAGEGTILVDPSDGDLGLYLASLERLRARAPGALLPSHGPALPAGEAVLDLYVAHRHMRSAQILEALQARGVSLPRHLVAAVYPELPELAHALAARQIESHLRWLVGQGRATEVGEGRWQAA